MHILYTTVSAQEMKLLPENAFEMAPFLQIGINYGSDIGSPHNALVPMIAQSP